DRRRANEWMDRTRQVGRELGVRVTMPPNFGVAEAGVARGQPAPRACGKPPVKCWFLWQRAYVTHEGAVVPCCLAGIPHFGNMMDEGFWAVWNGETYQTYRRHVFTERPY